MPVRMRLSVRSSNSLPSSSIEPSATLPPPGSSRMTESAVMDLPHPDSPSNAKVSPARISSDSPLTGVTVSLPCPMRVVRLSMRSTVSVI